MKRVLGKIAQRIEFISFRIFLLITAILFATCLHAGAQHNNELVVKGCSLSVQSGANLIVKGDLRVEGLNSQLRNNGFLEVQGNMYSDTLFQQRGTGTTRFHNRSLNAGETQFIQGSCAVRGGTSAIGVNDGSFYSLELANTQGIVWLNGSGNVADVRNQVDFAPAATGSPVNRIITHNPATIPSTGASYSAVFGMMNSAAGLGNFLNNSVTINGNTSAIDNGYIQGKLRRAISPAGGIYGFVTGTQPGATSTDARGIQYVHLNFAANSYDVFTGFFNPFSNNIIFGSSNECGYYVDYFGGANHGEWSFSPSFAGTGVYEVKIWPQDFLSNPQTIYIITQNDAVMGTSNDCGPTPIALDRSGFSDGGSFGFAGGSNPLAANSLILDTKITINLSVELKWTDKNENTTSYYEIEKGSGTSGFLNMEKKIKSENNSNTGLFFVDHDLSPETKYFYRLKGVGLDGEISYSNTSEIITLNHSDSENQIRIFPNPAKGEKVTIEWMSLNSENVLINVFDLNGKEVLQKELQTESGLNQFQIEIDNWFSGLYFFSISGRKTLTGKFIVD